MDIQLVYHNDTEWIRDVDLIHEGKTYRITVMWAKEYGYEIISGWDTLPESIKDRYEFEHDLASEIDEATHLAAYNKVVTA